jgi:hypothetical protein
MPTPTERLSLRKALQECRVCAWLSILDEKARREWQLAIVNPRFGAALVASELAVEMTATGYDGSIPGETSVQTHRQRGHR